MGLVEGMARWNFAQVAHNAAILLEPTLREKPWLPPNLVLEGGAIANLKLGRIDDARAFYQALKLVSYPEPFDLRRQFVFSYLAQPDTVAFAP
jgi:hypothetical protein